MTYKNLKEFEMVVVALVPDNNNIIDTDIKVDHSELKVLTSYLKSNKRGKVTISAHYKKEGNRKNDQDIFSPTSFSYNSMRKFLFKGIDINEKNVNKKIHDLAESVVGNKILAKKEEEKYLQLNE